MIRHFLTEVKYLQLLQHPNIVKVLATDTNAPLPINILTTAQANASGSTLSESMFERCSYIAMEFAERGNLFEYVCFKPMSENATLFYLRQLLGVIHFMQTTHNVCHRDLKPENLLLDANYDLKVADFGFAAPRRGA